MAERVRKYGKIISISLIVLALFLIPASFGQVYINNGIHLNFSHTKGPVFFNNTTETSVSSVSVNEYGSVLNFTGTVPYYKSGSTANFTSAGEVASTGINEFIINVSEVSGKNLNYFKTLAIYSNQNGNYSRLSYYAKSLETGSNLQFKTNSSNPLKLDISVETGRLSGSNVYHSDIVLLFDVQMLQQGKVYAVMSYYASFSFTIEAV